MARRSAGSEGVDSPLVEGRRRGANPNPNPNPNPNLYPSQVSWKDGGEALNGLLTNYSLTMLSAWLGLGLGFG